MSIETDPLDYLTWPSAVPRPTVAQVCTAVALCLDVPPESVTVGSQAPKRTADAVMARALASLVMRRVRGMSTPECARAIGTKSHSCFTSGSGWHQRLMSAYGGIAMHNAVVRLLVNEQAQRLGGEAVRE